MAITDLYSDKQIEVLKFARKNDFFMLINHGAKRSGKTIVDNDIFIQELRRIRKIADHEMVNEPQYILAGATLSSLERNVLIELKNKYSLNIKLNKYNQFKLFGVLVCCFGHSITNDLDKIRGMTSYGAYINEATLANEEVFNEIKSRCSGTGARMVIDTNSDSPEHYLKKDYIDKEDGMTIKCFHWELEDNTKFLTPRYIENIKATTPSGMFWDRDILGLWVTAEGVVYADFNKDVHFIKTTEGINFKKYIAGVDWGYSHYGAIVVIGIDDKDNYYLIEEHAKQFEEIDYWVKIAKEIKTKYGNISFYCDTARPEYIERFNKEGIRAIDADKAVLSGIEAVAKLYKTNRLFIIDTVKRFREEIYMYVWAEKKDEPLKVYDDVQDAIRYAIYTSQQENKMRMSNRPFINIPTR